MVLGAQVSGLLFFLIKVQTECFPSLNDLTRFNITRFYFTRSSCDAVVPVSIQN
jgi:hypothetical protein